MPVASPNFMLSDLIGVSAAFFLFPLFLFIPGYVCGWLLDAFGFRQRSLLARFAASVALSVGISPILAYLSWHWSILTVWAVFGAMWIGFIGLFFHERRMWLSRHVVAKRRVAFIAIVAGWIVLGTFLLIDLQFKDRLYFPLVAYDYTLRTAITASITRSGVPPNNPYFFPGRAFALRYHYFWFILCSLVNQIGGNLISARQAMIAGTVWCGIGLMAVIPLYLRFFQPKGPVNLDRRMLIGVGLLSVTGLNILIVAIFDVFSRNLLQTNTAVLPWTGELMWAPHQVASLIACLTGFLLIRYRRDRQDMRANAVTTVAAGIVFASAAGLSVYVTFVFAVFLAVWVAVTIIRRQFRESGIICAAGVVALALCLPYTFELLGGHSNQSASGGPFLQFTIRSFPITESLISSSHPAQGWLIPVANALFLPLNYFLELGFFFLIGFRQLRKMRATESFFGHRELCGFAMAATSVLVCTFLRSSVITYNDLGIRGFMVAQFVLLIWGAELLDEGPLRRKANRTGNKLLVAALVLGITGTAYDLCILRWFPIIADVTDIPRHKWLSPDQELGSRTYALRQLYEDLKVKLPQTAVLQHNPDIEPGDLPYGLYADRQVAAETLSCGVVFGGVTTLCREIIGPIRDFFEKPGAVAADRVERVCKDLSINALIVKDTDPVWADSNSWVWKQQPLITNRYARAFVCGENVKSTTN